MTEKSPSYYAYLGKKIYTGALEGRRGFRQDQLGIDDDVWDDIMADLGFEAIEVVMAKDDDPINEGAGTRTSHSDTGETA